MGEDASTAIELASRKFAQKPYHSYTILRAKFDQWLADKVIEAGGMVITKNRVDDLIMDGTKVRGIIAGEDKIPANVVLAADGVMSQVAEKAGLHQRQKPLDYAVAIKEVIELSPQIIEQRFNLEPGKARPGCMPALSPMACSAAVSCTLISAVFPSGWWSESKT